MKTIGLRIKLARTSAGVNQKTLAAGINKTTNYLSLIENDKRTPGLKTIHDIESYLGTIEGSLHSGGATTTEGANFDMMACLVRQVEDNKERLAELLSHVQLLMTKVGNMEREQELRDAE